MKRMTYAWMLASCAVSAAVLAGCLASEDEMEVDVVLDVEHEGEERLRSSQSGSALPYSLENNHHGRCATVAGSDVELGQCDGEDEWSFRDVDGEIGIYVSGANGSGWLADDGDGPKLYELDELDDSSAASWKAIAVYIINEEGLFLSAPGQDQLDGGWVQMLPRQSNLSSRQVWHLEPKPGYDRTFEFTPELYPYHKLTRSTYSSPVATEFRPGEEEVLHVFDAGSGHIRESDNASKCWQVHMSAGGLIANQTCNGNSDRFSIQTALRNVKTSKYLCPDGPNGGLLTTDPSSECRWTYRP